MVAVYLLLVPAAALALLAGAHWYVWRRLVRDVSVPGSRWRRTGTLLAFALPALTVAALAASLGGAPLAVARVPAWPGYLWAALLLYLVLALLVGEAVRPLLRWAAAHRDARRRRPGDDAGDTAPDTAAHPASGSASGAVPKAPGASLEGTAVAPAAPAASARAASRRVFVARSVAAGAGLLAAGTVAEGTREVLRGPRLKRITVPLARLPRSAHGYRIAVVSDIHLGPILGRAHTERVVRTINHAQPDLVAIVGDLADGSTEELGPAAEPLSELRPRHGAFFVTGNHEYFGDADAWIACVRELGVHPLENARRELPGFDLAGVNDLQGARVGEGPDYGRALDGRDPARASVLLAHQPVQIHEAVRRGVDLQLSGHTHGGQLWPGNFVAALSNPTVAGLDRYGDTQLYVTRGAGAWGPPVRVGAPPDVTVVQLASRRA